MIDRIIQERFVSTHLVLDLADLLDDGFTGFDPFFHDGRREIARLSCQFMSNAVEVVDDCGEDYRPSSNESFVAAVCCRLTERRIG